MGQLIDITARLKSRPKSDTKTKKKMVEKHSAEVLDLEGPRLKKKEEERREVKRTILSEFISAFVIIPDKGLKRVGLFDISDTGIAFDVPMEDGAFAKGEEVALRIYLNQMTYYPFIVKVAHVSSSSLDGINRHGSIFLKNTIKKGQNDALHHFVKFIEAISGHIKQDSGDLVVSDGVR